MQLIIPLCGTACVQEEDFDEDEGIYDDLHLEEEEDALGLLHDHEHDEAVSESDLQSVSEGEWGVLAFRLSSTTSDQL